MNVPANESYLSFIHKWRPPAATAIFAVSRDRAGWWLEFTDQSGCLACEGPFADRATAITTGDKHGWTYLGSGG